jgi:site-specific DNA recombinase
VPLGYEARDKKLVINKPEAETVRTIFRLYLELKSFSKLVAELDRRKLVTKRRDTKVAKYQGGIPFTYGPLAYFLKNRIYIGEVHHGGKWFKGEHKALLNRQTFELVQELLKSNTNGRRGKYSKSGALLQGKLYDDKGNLMGPSFSTNKGVRYRFYVSTALRGRKERAGSVRRISASEVEGIVEGAAGRHPDERDVSMENWADRIECVVVAKASIRITFKRDDTGSSSSAETIDIPRTPKEARHACVSLPPSDGEPDQKLLQSIVRAHAWLNDLSSGRYTSVKDLADAAHLHPKVIRQGLRLAFVAPGVRDAILSGTQPSNLTLARIPKRLPLSWVEHRQLLR